MNHLMGSGKAECQKEGSSSRQRKHALKVLRIGAVILLLVAIAIPQIVRADSWGPWMYVAPGIEIQYARVNAKTWTWAFRNSNLACTLQPFNFSYSYVDADTGQYVTQHDIEPLKLAPRRALGGWSAYTANSRTMPTIIINEPYTCR
jgi:hypothetical protein